MLPRTCSSSGKRSKGRKKKKITGNSSGPPQIIHSAGKYDRLFFRTRMLRKRQNKTVEKNKTIVFRVVLGTHISGDCFPKWWKKPTPARDWYQATCFCSHSPLNGKKKGLWNYFKNWKLLSPPYCSRCWDRHVYFFERKCLNTHRKYHTQEVTSTSYFSGAIKSLPHNARTNAVTEEQHF